MILPTAIKGFLSGSDQQGNIVQMIDIDTQTTFVNRPDVIEKYIVVLMELGLVVLYLKY
jgi:hypothetical protein